MMMFLLGFHWNIRYSQQNEGNITMKTSNKINPITWQMFQGKYAIDKLFVQEEIFFNEISSMQ